MPWGVLIKEVIEFISASIPKYGTVLDLLCGTGYLIGELQKRRPDVTFTGIDLNKEFIDFAQKQYSGITFVLADVLDWKTPNTFDAILCTGGLHHLHYKNQKDFIKKISTLLKPEAFALIADPYIGSYSNEEERKKAAITLGKEYLAATIQNGAPEDVVQATAALINNDVSLVEFKDSVEHIESYLKEVFSSVEKHKTWPEEESEYGDYYFILRK